MNKQNTIRKLLGQKQIEYKELLNRENAETIQMALDLLSNNSKIIDKKIEKIFQLMKRYEKDIYLFDDANC